MYISSISAPDIRLLIKGDESALRKVYDCHGEVVSTKEISAIMEATVVI